MIGLLFVAAALRLLPLGAQSLWYDEVFTFNASAGSLPRLYSILIEDGQHPPLHYLLSWLVLRLGHSEAMLRLPSALLGLASLLGLFALTRRLATERAALYATALATLSSFHVLYSHEARNWMLLLALTVLGSQLLLEAATRPRWWPAYGLTMTAALLSNNLALPVLCAHGLFALSTRSRTTIIAWLTSAAFAVAWAGAWQLLIRLGNPDYANRLAPGRGSGAHLLATLMMTNFDFAVGYARGFSKAELDVTYSAVMLAQLVATALLVVGAVTLMRERRAALVLTGLLVPLAMAAYLALTTHFHQTRYAMGAYPFFLILVAVGADAAVRWQPPLIVVPGLLLAMNLLGTRNYLSLPVYQRDDFRSVARHLDRAAQHEDLIVINAGWEQVPLRHYLRRSLSVVGIPMKPQLDQPEPQFRQDLDRDLTRATARHQRVWLVLCYDEVSDPRGCVRDWFEQRWRRVELRRFAGYPQWVRVIRFESK